MCVGNFVNFFERIHKAHDFTGGIFVGNCNGGIGYVGEFGIFYFEALLAQRVAHFGEVGWVCVNDTFVTLFLDVLRTGIERLH